MALNLRWVGEADYDRVAEARMLCYAPSTNMLPRYVDGMRKYHRAKPGDFLLAERDGQAVGTATSLSLTIWLRGGALPCQGVAFVGTIKTARRLGSGETRGIATQLMHETLRKAREREQPVTALMPFRASYYEHFGYGNAEHRVDWTVPLSILPRGDFDGFRFYRDGDLPRLMEARQREVERGHGDIETTPAAWEFWMAQWPDGLVAVDAPDPAGPIHSFVYFGEDRNSTRSSVQVWDWSADSPAALLRIFNFLGSLKDQYSEVQIGLAGDYPLNRVLRESQIPHRQVDHPVAVPKPYTRMQIRVLDHKRALEAMRVPPHVKGRAAVAVKETEGQISRFTVDLSDGHASVAPSTHTPDVQITDVLWASIISGDLSASKAVELGLLASSTPASAVELLDAFSIGPRPFCQEYF